MEKLKDWFYNCSDIFVGLLITIVAGFVIFGSVSKIMSFSDSFHVLAESSKNNNGPVIHGSMSSGGVDVVPGTDIEDENSTSGSGIGTTPSGVSSGSAVTSPASGTTPSSSTPTSAAVNLNPSQNTAGQSANTVRKRITIEIPAGSAASTVAQLLKEKSLITDTNDFLSVLIASKLDAKLRSGSFDIPEGSNVTEIISILTGQ